MFEISVHPVPDAVRQRAYLNDDDYQRLYRQSVENPDEFWGEQAKAFLDWFKPWHSVHHGDLRKGQATWFKGGQLNVAYNCIDRHLERRGEQIAIVWEGDNPSESAHITYRKLHHNVCRLANVLKSRGVEKGDRVCIYMPMIPEAAYAMLACARIGAVHSVVFGGFAGLAARPHSRCRLPHRDHRRRGRARRQVHPAEAECGKGAEGLPGRLHRGGGRAHPGRHTLGRRPRHLVPRGAPRSLSRLPGGSDGRRGPAVHPLYLRQHRQAEGRVAHHRGYLLGAAMTHKYVFDYHDGDVYWCTADVGWVTGHSYIVYGPLANGATTLMFEGVPNYPDASRFWQVIDKHQVNIFYTAPTAIRALMREGDAPVRQTSRSSLRLLGSVGEPINPEAWEWYYQVVGEKRCPIVDTWWQTETGSILITRCPAPLR